MAKKTKGKNNPETQRRYFKMYYKKHKEKLLQRKRERYQNDPEYRAKVLERANERRRTERSESER